MPKDIMLDADGDIYINDSADIVLRSSIQQDVKIRLRWFLSEWRFAPEAGISYFDNVFIKNPNVDTIKQIVRDEAGKADGVNEVKDISVQIDNSNRSAKIQFTLVTDYGEYREELTANV